MRSQYRIVLKQLSEHVCTLFEGIRTSEDPGCAPLDDVLRLRIRLLSLEHSRSERAARRAFLLCNHHGINMLFLLVCSYPYHAFLDLVEGRIQRFVSDPPALLRIFLEASEWEPRRKVLH